MSSSVALKLRKHGIHKILVPKGGLDRMPSAGFTLYRGGDIIVNGKIINKKK